MEPRKERTRRTCWDAAKARAGRRRRSGKGHLVVIALMVLDVLFPYQSRPVPVFARSVEPPRGPNEYERGEFFRPRPKPPGGRYASRPSLRRLMRDLRRPAARQDALEALLAIVSDPETRSWIVERIDDDEVNRISIFVRPGMSEEAVFAAWAAEARVPDEGDGGGVPTPPKPAP